MITHTVASQKKTNIMIIHTFGSQENEIRIIQHTVISYLVISVRGTIPDHTIAFSF